MTLSLAQIWRYPIKAIGAEALDQVTLTKGKPLPLDRAWALLEQGGDDAQGWRSCRNFLRGAKGPSLMAIMARVDGDTVHLTHPDLPELTIPLSGSATDALINWITPIYPATRKAPAALVKSPEEGMADVPFASVSVMNTASLSAISDKVGRDMDARRFRGNIWLDGLAPWAEFDLLGKTLVMGDTELKVVEPITRCRATEANPANGIRDVDTLTVLRQNWGHTDFGMNTKVMHGGTIAVGDTVVIQ